jgi:hypothetical protein
MVFQKANEMLAHHAGGAENPAFDTLHVLFLLPA